MRPAPVIDPATRRPVTIAFGTAIGQRPVGAARSARSHAARIRASLLRNSATAPARPSSPKRARSKSRWCEQTDTGTAGSTPGDTLAYTLNVAISDLLRRRQTMLGAGQFVDHRPPRRRPDADRHADLHLSRRTASRTPSRCLATHTVNADGTTTLTFDIGTSIATASGLQPGGWRRPRLRRRAARRHHGGDRLSRRGRPTLCDNLYAKRDQRRRFARQSRDGHREPARSTSST